MSAGADIICNGQNRFSASSEAATSTTTTTATTRRKRTRNLNWIYIAIPTVLLVAVSCTGIVALLYFLDLKLNTEIRMHNDKLNQEMKIFSDQINIKLQEYEIQIKRMNLQIEEIKDKRKTFPPGIVETVNFKGVAIENVEEYPEIENLEDDGLIDIAGLRASNKDLHRKNMLKPISNITGELDKQLSKNQSTKKNATMQTTPRLTVFVPASSEHDVLNDDIDQDIDNAADSDENDDTIETKFYPPKRSRPIQRNRDKRSAELANSGDVNFIDTSLEEFDRFHNRSNQTLFSKTSSLQHNQTVGVSRTDRKIQCNCTLCEESCKMLIQQKSSNRRLLPMKKAYITQDINLAAFSESEDEIIDSSEVRKPVIAAHFAADSSKYDKRTHHYYEGNHHLRHPTGAYEDWVPSSWFDELKMNRHFALTNGNITVHSPGLYFVYAQIFYTDLSDINGYVVSLNSQVVLQCITSTFTQKTVVSKSNTCYTGGIVKCNAGDKIAVRTVDSNKRVMLEATRSFVGMFKIGEIQSIK